MTLGNIKKISSSFEYEIIKLKFLIYRVAIIKSKENNFGQNVIINLKDINFLIMLEYSNPIYLLRYLLNIIKND